MKNNIVFYYYFNQINVIVIKYWNLLDVSDKTLIFV